MPHKCSFNNARRWPSVANTGTSPSIGQRLSILGALKEFSEIPLCDDSFANDALWRLTPSIWSHALIVATHGVTTLECTHGGASSGEPTQCITPPHTGSALRYGRSWALHVEGPLKPKCCSLGRSVACHRKCETLARRRGLMLARLDESALT